MSNATEAALTGEVRERLQGAVMRGEMIVAIKLYREATGVGLAEAKAAVEAIAARLTGGGASPARATPPAHATAPGATPPVVGVVFVLAALTVLALGVKLLSVSGYGNLALEQRYSQALSTAMLVMLSVQGCAQAHKPARRKLGSLMLAAALLLLAFQIYRTMNA